MVRRAGGGGVRVSCRQLFPVFLEAIALYRVVLPPVTREGVRGLVTPSVIRFDWSLEWARPLG